MRKNLLDNIRGIEPYVAGEQPKNANVIKLNTNENPYGPSPRIKELLQNFQTGSLRLYPDPQSNEFRSAVAKQYHRKTEEVFTGNGSDEILALIFLALFQSGQAVQFPEISYSFYPVWCDLFGIPYKTIPLREDFTLAIADFKPPNGGVILPNPNAPTSIYENLQNIEKILQQNPDVFVVIDEAYIDFGGASALTLLDRYENLVVVHTLSKSRGLAGIRAAYCFAHEEVINALMAVKDSFNSYPVDTLAQAIAVCAIEDEAHFNRCREKIIKTRGYFVQSLDQMGFHTLPSQANFVFTTHPSLSAEELFQYLKQKNIYVRYFAKPKLNQYLRISIGTEEEMDALTQEIRNFIKIRA